jgi:TRAP-type C4-dicarboxylate transport system substrate-binding protein
MSKLFVALLLCVGLVNAATAVTLKIATISPDGTSWMQSMREAAKLIDQRTQGRVKLRFYPGGVMGNDASVLRKIRINQLQGGAISSGGLASIDPDIQIYSLPLLFQSYDEADRVRQQMDPIILGQLEDKGFVSYGFGEGGFAYFMSSQPIRSVDELKQRKVWVPEGDDITRISLETLGISPIPLPLTDVLTGLQTGLIDTIASSPVASIALQWHTRVKYLTELPVLYFTGTLVISERARKKLSREDQQVLAEIMQKTFRDISKQNRRDNHDALAALKKQGIAFITPSSQGQEQWRTEVKQAMDDMSRSGHFSRELYLQIQQLLKQYRGE